MLLNMTSISINFLNCWLVILMVMGGPIVMIDVK